MSPPIPKDWWLAAALTGASLPVAMAQPVAGTAPQAGVVTAVAPNSSVMANNQVMMVGSNVVPGQRLRTDANGQLHVLFMDQSALTLGSDSELTIDEFNFDPATKQGRIRLGLTKGIVRVVGGQISKTTATTVVTPHGKIEILGGITIAETDGSRTSGVFLFGQGMQATDNQGNTQTVTRAGFGTNFGSGSPPTSQRVPSSQLGETLSRLEAKPGEQSPSNQQPGGAPPGQLLSTGSQPTAGGSPENTLANDRMKSVVDNTLNSNPSLTLKDLLGSKQSPNQS